MKMTEEFLQNLDDSKNLIFLLNSFESNKKEHDVFVDKLYNTGYHLYAIKVIISVLDHKDLIKFNCNCIRNLLIIFDKISDDTEIRFLLNSVYYYLNRDNVHECCINKIKSDSCDIIKTSRNILNTSNFIIIAITAMEVIRKETAKQSAIKLIEYIQNIKNASCISLNTYFIEYGRSLNSYK